MMIITGQFKNTRRGKCYQINGTYHKLIIRQSMYKKMKKFAYYSFVGVMSRNQILVDTVKLIKEEAIFNTLYILAGEIIVSLNGKEVSQLKFDAFLHEPKSFLPAKERLLFGEGRPLFGRNLSRDRVKYLFNQYRLIVQSCYENLKNGQADYYGSWEDNSHFRYAD